MSEQEFIIIIKSRDLGSDNKIHTRAELICPGCKSKYFSHAFDNRFKLLFTCAACNRDWNVSDLISNSTIIQVDHV